MKFSIRIPLWVSVIGYLLFFVMIVGFTVFLPWIVPVSLIIGAFLIGLIAWALTHQVVLFIIYKNFDAFCGWQQSNCGRKAELCGFGFTSTEDRTVLKDDMSLSTCSGSLGPRSPILLSVPLNQSSCSGLSSEQFLPTSECELP